MENSDKIVVELTKSELNIIINELNNAFKEYNIEMASKCHNEKARKILSLKNKLVGYKIKP